MRKLSNVECIVYFHVRIFFIIGAYMKKTLIIGPAYVETVAHVNVLPKGNEDIKILSKEELVTGAGVTTARIFQTLGLDYDLIAPYGDGIYGDFVAQSCKTQNIQLTCHFDGFNGSRYTMQDKNGDVSQFIMPGVEYEFDRCFTDSIYPEEIASVCVYGDMMMGDIDSVSDLIETVEDLKKTFYFVPDGCSDSIDTQALEAMLSFHPTLFLSDSEAYYLSGEYSGELRDTSKHIFEKTHAPVMIFKQGEGVFVYDGEECYLAQNKDNIDLIQCFSYFLCAKECGIDQKNALMFALQYWNAEIPQITERLKELIMVK